MWMRAKDSRQGILEVLMKEDCSVSELCEKLWLSSTAVRQHLAVLERDGLVERGAKRERMGRPKFVYSLTEKAEGIFPKRYSELLGLVLEELIELKGHSYAMRIMEAIAKKNATRYQHLFEGKGAEECLEQLVKLLNEFGAYSEQKREDGRLTFRSYNCIFSEPAVKFDPLICRYDVVFFETLLGEEVVKKSSQTKGKKCCVFEVRV